MAEYKCGEQITVTYGGLKSAQNEAYQEGVTRAIQLLVGLAETKAAMILESALKGEQLYWQPICTCEPKCTFYGVPND